MGSRALQGIAVFQCSSCHWLNCAAMHKLCSIYRTLNLNGNKSLNSTLALADKKGKLKTTDQTAHSKSYFFEILAWTAFSLLL